MMLDADGESQGAPPVPVLDEVKTLKPKHSYRETIGSRLIAMDLERYLFNRIPLLKLPSIIRDYLLYGMSLEMYEYPNDSREDKRQVEDCTIPDSEGLSSIMYIGVNEGDESEDESENEDTSNHSDDYDSDAISGLHGIIPPFLGGSGPLPGQVSLRMPHEQ